VPNDRQNVPRPGQSPGAIKREVPSVKAFHKSAHDTIYPAGEEIQIDPNDQAGYIVRQGSISVEMIITAPGGLQKIGLDTVEAGEYFNIHSLFGFQLDTGTKSRYRTECQTVTMRVTQDMLPQDPKRLAIIFRSFMQTAARREGKLRQLTGYALQRAEEKRADRTGGNKQVIENLRATLEERDARIADLERSYAEAMKQRQNVSSSHERLIKLENANAGLRRDKLRLTENAKESAAEIKKLKEKLDLEQRMRTALGHRNKELTQKLAAQSSAVSQSKFPAANLLLESSGLNDLEMDARRFRKAASHFESLATMMQRAMELLAEDNPGMVISEDVMMLMTGEEPKPRASVEKARAHRDSADFKTVHLGSESPEVAAARAPAHARTAVIGSGDPGEHTPRQAPRPDSRPASTRSVERFPTLDETPRAKRGPDAQSSRQLSSRRHPTDRQITAVEAPKAIAENPNGHRSGEHHAPPEPQGDALFSPDEEAKFLELFKSDDSPATPRVSAPPDPVSVSAPYPGGPEEFSWSDEDEPSSSQTRPFIPDDDHPAPDIEVSIPPEPPTPRLSEPARMKTPVDGARRAGMIGHNGKISQRHLHPVDHDRFSPQEADSDITPVVPEFPRDDPPSLRPRSKNQTRGWEGDTVLARPGEMPIEERETPTRREGSGSKHPAITFPDEGTDVRQIEEDWRGELRQTMPSSDPDELPIPPSSANIPPPPADIFGEIEPDPSELMSIEECDEQDSQQGGTTQAYSSPGQVICRPKPPKQHGDIRTTQAWNDAPGKPPRPPRR